MDSVDEEELLLVTPVAGYAPAPASANPGSPTPAMLEMKMSRLTTSSETVLTPQTTIYGTTQNTLTRGSRWVLYTGSIKGVVLAGRMLIQSGNLHMYARNLEITSMFQFVPLPFRDCS